jgi:hypothetical protein
VGSTIHPIIIFDGLPSELSLLSINPNRLIITRTMSNYNPLTDPYYLSLVAGHIDPNMALILTQQNRQFTAMQDEIRNIAASSSKVGTPTNVEGILNAIVSELESYENTNRAPTNQDVERWRWARDWYKFCGSIKDSFEKANNGERPDSDAIKFKSFADLLGFKGSKSGSNSSSSNSNQGGKKCSRCSRTGHTKSACFAKTDVDGIKLE